MNSSALEIWQKQLAFLQQQEAITADPGIKFEIMQKIEECKRKIAELQGSQTREPAIAPPQIDRLKLRRTLQELIPANFNDLLYVLNAPSGIIPSSQADQASRVDALLHWAKSPTGPGLAAVQEALTEILNNP
jgi:hypothetical protein